MSSVWATEIESEPVITTPTVNITMKDDNNDALGYDFFRLMNLTMSLKTAHVAHEGDHTPDCYNYAYTVNSKYQNHLWKSIKEYSPETIDDEATYTSAQKDEIIIDYISTLTSDSEEIRKFGEVVLKNVNGAVPDKTITGEGEGFTTIHDALQGWYLIREHAPRNGELADKTSSYVIFTTAGMTDITVQVKDPNCATIEKFIIDRGGNEVKAISAEFKEDTDNILKVTLPMDDVNKFNKYKITIYDSTTSSVVENSIYIKGLIPDEGTETTEDGYYPLSALSCVSNEPSTGLPIVLKIEDVKGHLVDNSGLIQVKFKQKGIDNYTPYVYGRAFLTYSNNPYNENHYASTLEVGTQLYQYHLIVKPSKQDAAGYPTVNTTEGFEFKLMKLDETSEEYNECTQYQTSTTNTSYFNIYGLEAGTYKLVQTKSPDGYVKANDIDFTVTEELSLKGIQNLETDNDNIRVSISGGGSFLTGPSTQSVSKTYGVLSVEIVNKAGSLFPTTGGQGLTAIYVVGSLLVACGIILLIAKKKK